jgi:hypothetical protein
VPGVEEANRRMRMGMEQSQQGAGEVKEDEQSSRAISSLRRLRPGLHLILTKNIPSKGPPLRLISRFAEDAHMCIQPTALHRHHHTRYPRLQTVMYRASLSLTTRLARWMDHRMQHLNPRRQPSQRCGSGFQFRYFHRFSLPYAPAVSAFLTHIVLLWCSTPCSMWNPNGD